MRSPVLFLSTPSARRATNCVMGYITIFTISIHALREEGDPCPFFSCVDMCISIHALREEGDVRPVPPVAGRSMYFYPRPPRGGRPFLLTYCATYAYISIHALREEGDPRKSAQSSSNVYFYPRPPRGGRLFAFPMGSSPVANFYPRPPRGGRQVVPLRPQLRVVFLSTPSARRATRFRPYKPGR